MKKAIILYSKEDYLKNKRFVDAFKKEFKFFDIDLILKFDDEIDDNFDGNNYLFCLNRTRNHILIEKIMSKGVKVFSNAFTNKIANNKYKTYEYLSKNNIPCIKPYLNYQEVNEFPLVMKSIDGHGGNEVFKVQSVNEIQYILNKFKNKTFIYQKLLKNSDDIRCYMLKGECILLIKREKLNEEFKSNYSLNHHATLIENNGEIIGISKKIVNLLDSFYIGIDFMNIDGKYVVNEIEDPVGSRMIYDLTNIDLVKLLVKNIIEEVKI